MRVQIPAGVRTRVRAFGERHPGIIPAIGVGATIVAAYAGIVALRRGSAPGAGPAAFPGLSDLSSDALGIGGVAPPPPFGVGSTPPVGLSPGGGGYDPIAPVVNVGPSNLERFPTITAGPTLAIRPGVDKNAYSSPAGPVSPAIARIDKGAYTDPANGANRNGVAPIRLGAKPTSGIYTVPSTGTPAGHVSSQAVIRRVGPAAAPVTAPNDIRAAIARKAAAPVTAPNDIRAAIARSAAPAAHVSSQAVIRRHGPARPPALAPNDIRAVVTRAAATSYSSHQALVGPVMRAS